MENLFTKDCIRTFTGQYVNVFEPDPATILIEDICHGISMQCRFGGHLPVFYSVGQHSVQASYLVDEPHKLSALLHDASEAYLLDIPRPIKQRLANYKEIENGLMKVIAEKFGFEYPLSKEVKEVDEFLLQSEWDTIMLQRFSTLYDIWDTYRTKQNFMNQYKVLTTKNFVL